MEVEFPELVKHFKGHKGAITSLSFNPSMKRLASSSTDEFIMLWNISALTNSIRYSVRKLPVTHVSFSPSGEYMVSSQGPYVRIWVPQVHGNSTEFKAHTSTVRSVQYSPNQTNLVTASDDKSVKLWSSNDFKFISSFVGHTNWVRLAKYSTDGNMIASTSDDKSVKLWDPLSGKLIHTFNEIKGIPRWFDFHPTGQPYIATAMTNNIVKIYDLKTMKLHQHYDCHSGPVNSLAFHPSGHYLITGSDDKTCKVLDLVEGRPIFTIEGHTGGVTSVAFSKKGNYFATGSSDKQVLVWQSNIEPKIFSGDYETVSQSSHSRGNKAKEPRRVSVLPLNKPLYEPEVQEVYSVSDYQDEGKSENRVPSEESVLKEISGNVVSSQSDKESSDSTSDSNRDPIIELVSLVKNLTVEVRQMRSSIGNLEKRFSKLEASYQTNT